MVTILRNILFILTWTGLFILINIAVTLITVTTLYYLDYFARTYMVKVKILFVCSVLQLNKSILDPLYLLSGLLYRLAEHMGLLMSRCLTFARRTLTYELYPSKVIGWYWFNKGLAFERNGEYRVATQYYEKAYIHNPTKVDIWYNLGYCYRQDKQCEKAIACFRKVRLLDQNQEYDVLYYIGSCLGELRFGVA